MMDRKDQKRIEQAEYRAKIAEAELGAVKSSKAYKASKAVGVIKAQIKKDPVGLTKKIVKKVMHEPSKIHHLLRSAQRGAFIAGSVREQTQKYQEWILLNEPDEVELDEQRRASDNFSYQPTISIITPVFNPPVDVLEELIESVLEQTYPHFELCLGDFGDDESVKELIARYAKLDLRIKSYAFTENKGIAYNSNLILKKVTGEFIALLDHDDTLSPDALFENARLLNQKSYDFIYSDKDKIDEKGNRFEPLFKPQFSPEMLLNINYLTHLNIMRTSIVKGIGGWDSETDGAQDWDLFLRVIKASKLPVGHIPKVLYHWRVIATSTAMSIETKPYALAGQRKAIDKYLDDLHIPAHTYHQKTELFLKWDREALDSSPVVFIYFTNLTNTSRLMRAVGKVVQAPKFIVLLRDNVTVAQKITSVTNAETVVYTKDNFGEKFQAVINRLKITQNDKTVLVLRDDMRTPKNVDWYENLTGWLAIKDVAISAGRLVDRHDLIVRSAGIITPEHTYSPLFYKFPRFYQTYLGNAEWVRNVSVVPGDFAATKLSVLKAFKPSKAAQASRQVYFDEYSLQVSSKHRIVMTPHATASIYEDNEGDGVRNLPVSRLAKLHVIDKFSNPNVSASDPMRLFEDEQLVGISKVEDPEPSVIDSYQHDAIILAGTFNISADEIARNADLLSQKVSTPPTSAAWILPSYDAVYAGLMNIFSFADHLSKNGLKTTFYILKNSADASSEHKLAAEAFPGLQKAKFKGITPEQASAIEAHDIGIATQWATTYPLAKTTHIKRKYYFIQDNEVNFYPKGTISALVENSYRFGFTAIAGTKGLLEMYSKQYGGDGTVLGSKIDLSAYHPRQDMYYAVKKPYKVFFYARPNMPRNAFELGIAGLKVLKHELGEDVEIITAGAPWSPQDYGVDGMFNNLGKIAYSAVPKLYRSVDAGLMFMFSGHPGVTASELMASGCPVVVNEYDDPTWHELYQHEKTCLVTKATANEVARNIKRCLTEPNLRKTLIEGGLKKSAAFYRGYETSLEDNFKKIRENKL